MVLRAVRLCAELNRDGRRVFDVLGHLDFVKRYTRRFFDANEVSQFGDLVDEILAGCVEAHLVPELNTSTLRQGLGEPMPAVETVAKYAAVGGTAMSLGSDAHRSEDVGADLHRASTMLRRAGVNALAVFENRQRRDVPLARGDERSTERTTQ